MNNQKTNHNCVIVYVLSFFLISVFARFFLADFSKSLSTNDELAYLDIAKSIANGTSFLVENIEIDFPHMLYSVLLAPVFRFVQDGATCVKIITLINAFLMSSVVFPTYLLTKKLTGNKITQIVLAGLVLTLPDLTYSMGFMSENLYYAMAIWFVFFSFDMLMSDGKPLLCNVLLGVFACLLYFTKIVGLAFIIGYASVLFIYRFFLEKNLKKLFYEGICFTIGFLLFYLLFQLIFLGGIENYYSQQLTSNSGIYGMLYLIYALFYNTMLVILAFMVFPIVIPLFSFNNMDDKEKKLFIYACITLGVLQVIIAKTISMREDLGLFSPRQHLRYSAPILIMFLIVFFVLLEKQKKDNIDLKSAVVFLCVYVVVFVVAFKNISYGSAVDGTLLDYVTNFFGEAKYNLAYINSEMIFNKGIIVLKILVVLGVALGISALIFCKKRLLVLLFAGAICLINLLNNYCSIKAFHQDYPVDEEIVKEIELIDNYFSKLDEQVLYIGERTNRYVATWDTYYSGTEIIVMKETLLEQVDSNKPEKVSNIIFSSAIFNRTYQQIDSIDYIIMHKSVDDISISELYGEPVYIDGVDSYYIFKNKSDTVLCLGYASLPKESGECVELYQEQMITPTDNEEIISVTNGESVLVYGPYIPITEGIYNIKFYYDFVGDYSNEPIGYVDINMPDTNNMYYREYIYANQKMTSLQDIVVFQNSETCELRLFSYVKGVVFDKIVVEKK